MAYITKIKLKSNTDPTPIGVNGIDKVKGLKTIIGEDFLSPNSESISYEISTIKDKINDEISTIKDKIGEDLFLPNNKTIISNEISTIKDIIGEDFFSSDNETTISEKFKEISFPTLTKDEIIGFSLNNSYDAVQFTIEEKLTDTN